ncbi:MAG: aminotransferase class I/II-fold pyridoxal phosphate-dependent enzyme [Clostridium butyricum]|nr:aminotransferase class I/II-fold pyridoxal phosphate-dependent enzyme [Clostridium butyricum]
MKAPLLEELIKYHNKKNLILSMPGNKCGRVFGIDDLGIEFMNNMGTMDITEVDNLDNFHKPEGVIKEAQEMLAKTYNAKKAYFLVNGSTSGNLASIFSAFNEGDEVIVERNCHKSVYNGLILRKLKVTYIETVIDEKNGVFLPPDKNNIYEAVNKCINPKGIIFTYPNYFGITYDIEEILKDLKKRGLKTIIDSAHGAHFGATDRLPKSVASMGDYVVLSAHKTLPSLTQGAYLMVNDDNEYAEFYIRAFLSTSPSYLIMASLDYARHYLDEYGKTEYERLISEAEVWKEKINALGKVQVLSKEMLDITDKDNYEVDLSRYVLILPDGYSGHKLQDFMGNMKIQCEMSFARGVVLILSPVNGEEDFLKIYNAIKKLDMNTLLCKKNVSYSSVIPQKVLEPYEVFNSKSEVVDIQVSEGRIAKESIIPYPPGIPLVCPGEVITHEAVMIIKDYAENERTIIGVKENKVNVIV